MSYKYSSNFYSIRKTHHQLNQIVILRRKTTMKFLLAILSLICLLLVQKLSAQPVNAASGSAEELDSRLGLPNPNCVIHCVQPSGKESADDDDVIRGIIGNYVTLFDCIKQCSGKK